MWRLPGPYYADVLVLCGESEQNLEEYRRRGLKVDAGKSKVTMLGGEE